mgnify:CR=1 FL=1
MINRRSLLVLPGALALTACMPGALEIEVSGTSSAIDIAAFRRDGPFELFRSGAAIGSAVIWRDDLGPQDPLWQLESSDCENWVRKLRYQPPQPLSAGVIYSVGVEDCGPSGGGGAQFRIVGDRVQQFWNLQTAS